VDGLEPIVEGTQSNSPRSSFLLKLTLKSSSSRDVLETLLVMEVLRRINPNNWGRPLRKSLCSKTTWSLFLASGRILRKEKKLSILKKEPNLVFL
jgi:hypothetical protein